MKFPVFSQLAGVGDRRTGLGSLACREFVAIPRGCPRGKWRTSGAGRAASPDLPSGWRRPVPLCCAIARVRRHTSRSDVARLGGAVGQVLPRAWRRHRCRRQFRSSRRRPGVHRQRRRLGGAARRRRLQRPRLARGAVIRRCQPHRCNGHVERRADCAGSTAHKSEAPRSLRRRHRPLSRMPKRY